MRSFSLICAVALAAGASAQSSTSIPGGCNPAHPGSCPSSYFQTLPSSAAASTPAASTPAVTTTITAHAGCPTPAADVMVTRSNAPVPSCDAGNGTKASIVSMASASGAAGGSAGSSGSGSGNASSTATGAPAQFTGAAGRNAVGAVMAVVGGAVVWFL